MMCGPDERAKQTTNEGNSTGLGWIRISQTVTLLKLSVSRDEFMRSVAGSRIVESMRDARWCEIVCTTMHRCVTARRSPIADRIPLIFERNVSSAIPFNPFFYQSEVIPRTHEQ